MKVFLLEYSVQGIKTLDKEVVLSFYKKTISNSPDTQNYNIKGIYGMNGSGKSGIVTSVDILKNLLADSGYLNNPLVQKNLNAIINKKTKELKITAEFLMRLNSSAKVYTYSVCLAKDVSDQYSIAYEKLTKRRTSSRDTAAETIFEVKNGEFVTDEKNSADKILDLIIKKTINLLSSSTMCSLFCEKIFLVAGNVCREDILSNGLVNSLMELRVFANSIHVYLDESDEHRKYLINTELENYSDLVNNNNLNNCLQDIDKNNSGLRTEWMNIVSVSSILVDKEAYADYETTVNSLYEFLKIFKPDLKGIEIDKKEDRDWYVCTLMMVYDSYKIHAEFESTGIKKLIRLFAYLREMVKGAIVFIDEFDSNLHDVYLCALLEYLMQYGKGQLCFTAHNVGPMDVLKHHKKSIDFLSMDHQIYSWTTSGNYSPSKLYRNGMIEGSPFNIDSIDFISAFGIGEDDD